MHVRGNSVPNCAEWPLIVRSKFGEQTGCFQETLGMLKVYRESTPHSWPQIRSKSLGRCSKLEPPQSLLLYKLLRQIFESRL